MRFSINIPNFGDFTDARTVARVAAAAEQAGWHGLFVWDHVVHDKGKRRGQQFGVALLPASVQRPRPPIWIGGFWPHRRPTRRAARWDGAVPLFTTAGHGHTPPVDEVRDLIAYISKHRGERAPVIRRINDGPPSL
jgi:alkanesulfonate monooxygenase SsuD/methylene tetrahydromethanopterin reductase-like flavin-dependent oxidoreductase (luciferase family)